MQIVSALVSIVGGLAVSFLIYFSLNWLVLRLPQKTSQKLLPWAFLLPVLVLIAAFLVYPALRTVFLSFFVGQARLRFVGLDNYTELLGSADFINILLNNLTWIVVVPAAAVLLGLAVATFADRVGPLREKVFKSIIFLPMAISFVAAATIWRFVYTYNPPGQPQVGLLNAIWTAITRGDPQPWLTLDTARLNSLLLMVVVIWLNAGFAMVLLSAAIKGVPEETIEAARMDGANERQTFFQVIAPQIRTTVVAVFVTILITVMKIFDIVYAMTGGAYGTSVLGVEFINQLFNFGSPGKAAAVVTLLMIAVIPVIVYQVRSNRSQEALR
jgi:alpha-glucoside transport system permease protein